MTTAAVAPTIANNAVRVRYDPQGGALALMGCRDGEVLMDGPANTGKSFAALWKLHFALQKYPGTRALLLRKTYASLKTSTLVTYRERVAKAWLDAGLVRFWPAKGDEPPHYAYAGGSKLVLGGMDNPGKVMSTEYDLLFWDEATDGKVDEWEALTTRMRYGVMPYRQMIGCVNPQGPTHWLNERANTGRMTRILSRHEDNPTVTAEYLAALDALTGVRRARLFLGLWAAAEGGIYEDVWDRSRNLVPRREYCTHSPSTALRPEPDGEIPAHLFGDCGIPRTWPRVIGVDFGFTHPFVAKWYALDPDGRLIRYREHYLTHQLVEDHARFMLRACGWEVRNGRCWPSRPNSDPLPYAIVCDHDAEDRHTLTRHLGLPTIAAYKDVSAGIQAVAARLRPAGDGKPRLIYLADSLLRRDQWLHDRRLPTCSEEEIEGYVWDQRTGQRRGEQPLKEHDHSMDVDRYVVAARDLRDSDVSYIPNVF